MTAQPSRRLVITGFMNEERHWFTGFIKGDPSVPAFTADPAEAKVFSQFADALLSLRALPFRTTFEIEPV